MIGSIFIHFKRLNRCNISITGFVKVGVGVEDKDDDAVGVVGEALEGAAVDRGREHEARTRGRHEQALPRRPVALLEAALQRPYRITLKPHKMVVVVLLFLLLLLSLLLSLSLLGSGTTATVHSSSACEFCLGADAAGTLGCAQCLGTTPQTPLTQPARSQHCRDRCTHSPRTPALDI